MQLSDVAEAAVTAHGAPQTVTRVELAEEKPSPEMTSSVPPATPTLVGASPLTARAAPVSCRVPVAHPQSARYSVTVCSPPMGGGSVHCSAVALTSLRLAHALSPTLTTGASPKPEPPSASTQLLAPASLEVQAADVSVGVVAALYSYVHAPAALTPRTLSSTEYVPAPAWGPVTQVTWV